MYSESFLLELCCTTRREKRNRGEEGADSYKLSGFVLSASHAFSSSKTQHPWDKSFSPHFIDEED